MSSSESPSTSSENGDSTVQYPLTEIDFNELVLQNAIGRGTYGLVQKAIWQGKEVAVKLINTEMERKAFQVELKQLQRVRHENIVKLYGACTRSRICLVMEYMEGGSLHDFLHSNPKIPYTSGHAVSWATQCADAVAYLHGLR
uniref:Mitogen-activated protein kinase kinase kinase n=1 Tax=Plectus sambesii TaxID=2011161 RepID=A0A914VEI0_9BILA